MPVKIAGSEELCGLHIKTASQTKRSDNRPVPMCNRSRQMRLQWFGHVLRMKVNTLTKSVHLTGKRSSGRLNKRWMDCIEEDQGPMTIRCNKVWKNTLNDIAVDRQHGGT